MAYEYHVHAEACAAWLANLENAELKFCRVTQMGLLRLLTNRSVMGPDVLSQADAWRTYARILSDDRMGFATEPLTLEEEWRRLTSSSHPKHKTWTDAYLAAFARSAQMVLVTFDRGTLALDPKALLLA
jgi:uncharacterized protein